MLMLILLKTLLNCSLLYFNTSHVNVNPLCSIFCNKYCSISIHLMLMLILKYSAQLLRGCRDFNTSHVNVNLTELDWEIFNKF